MVTEIKKQPVISILLSIKNGGRAKVSLTLASLAEQTISHIVEVLVCDDGSSDDTAEVLQEWEQKGICRVALRHKQSLGLTRSLIALEQLAQGEYLARIDVGDACAPDRLEKQLAVFTEHPDVGVVCSSALVMNKDGQYLGRLFAPLRPTVQLRHLLKKNFIVHGSIMMRRNIYQQIGGYDENAKATEDYDLWCRMAAQKIVIFWLHEPLYFLEIDETSISSTKRVEQADWARKIRQRYDNQNTIYKATNQNRMRILAKIRNFTFIGWIFRFAESLWFELCSYRFGR